MNEARYSIAVYEDYAIIKGWLSAEILCMLITLCEDEGFTNMIPHDDQGFKLVRKEK